jgi:hypothetical protein
MDEARIQRGPGFEALRLRLEALMGALAQADWRMLG